MQLNFFKYFSDVAIFYICAASTASLTLHHSRDIFGFIGAVSVACGLIFLSLAVRATVRQISDFEYYADEYDEADDKVDICEMDQAVRNNKVEFFKWDGRRLASRLIGIHCFCNQDFPRFNAGRT